jgi:hypothetical protein
VKKKENKTRVVKEKMVVVVKQKTVVGNCNPKSAKAQDPKYECNPLTNRWVKVRRVGKEKVVGQTTGCDPRSPFANNPAYECDPETNRWMPTDWLIKREIIRAHPHLTSIPNIYDRPLSYIIRLVDNPGNNKTKAKTTKTKAKTTKTKTKAVKTKVKTIQKQKQKQDDGWQKTCKEMEEMCPMETDLSGDNWCSLDPKSVFYYKKDNKRFCYGVEEIFSIIHLGFTARDTSYEVPPLRLQLPRDSYDRTPFPKEFFKLFKEHIYKNRIYPSQPEVCYFLKNYRKFYDDTDIKPFLTQTDPNKVQLSNAINRFLLKDRSIDINMNTSKWVWLPGKKPLNLRLYIWA